MIVSRAAENAGSERRIDLDWVRIAAFALLILYHIGMLYVSWGYHVKSQQRIEALEPLMRMLNPWRLALLFLVSGVATRFMVGKYAPVHLLKSRTVRLLPPLIFGMLVIVPPQAYEQVVESVNYSGSFLEFYGSYYFSFAKEFCHPGPCLLLPTWNHLWFVAYLWVYTLVIGVVLIAMPNVALRIEQVLTPIFSGAALLLVPAFLFAAYRLVLLPHFPSNLALMGDWYNHALFGTVFLFGFLFARAESVWTEIGRLRWWALLLAGIVFISSVVLRFMYVPGQPYPLPLKIYAGLAYGFYQWFAVVAVLGFAKRWLGRDSSARSYLTDAVFPYYIVHQTAIIMIAHQLKQYELPVWCEAAAVLAGTIAACAAIYEIVRRVTPLRPLFGLRLNQPTSQNRATAEGPVEARTGNS
jgi:hypothetical protein